MKKGKELTAEQLAVLNSAFPVDENIRTTLPRFGMLSKDITEESGVGKKKTIKVIESAGTFYTEKDRGEVDEKGKKVWTREYLGEKVEVIIILNRKQLKLYDASLKKYISSPIYDSKEQIIPLYLDKRQVAMGTEEELRAKYPKTSAKGQLTSKLDIVKILYVIYKEELYQFNLSQSSGYNFSDYKKILSPATVITELSSVEETFGTNVYRKMMFVSKGPITQDEFDIVHDNQTKILDQMRSDANYFLKQAEIRELNGGTKADNDFEAISAAGAK